MTQVLKIFIITIWVDNALCSIDGISYRQPYPALKPSQGDDPCNPLYWYPRHIPDYCNGPKPMPAPKSVVPAPAPPVPPPAMIPIPMPMPMPMPLPLPMSPPMMMPMPAYGPPVPAYGPPVPAYGPPVPPYGPPLPAYGPPMPFGPPAYPPIPVPYPAPYPAPVGQTGFVPGVEGLVTNDGGINILPFSDVYSDYLEKHKQKIIRIRLQELLDEYENKYQRKIRNHKRYYE